MDTNIMRSSFLAGALVALAVSTPVFADANSDLENLVEDYWADELREAPVFASSLGIDTYANELGDYTLAGQARQAASAAAFLQKLLSIPRGQLSADAAVEYDILERRLSETVEADGMGQRAINFTNRSGWHRTWRVWPINCHLPTRRTLRATIIACDSMPG